MTQVFQSWYDHDKGCEERETLMGEAFIVAETEYNGRHLAFLSSESRQNGARYYLMTQCIRKSSKYGDWEKLDGSQVRIYDPSPDALKAAVKGMWANLPQDTIAWRI